MKRKITRMLLTWAIIGMTPAWPHDIYNDLNSQGTKDTSESFQLCCNGDPVVGHCEGIAEPFIHPNGSATMYSRRLGRAVEVSAEKIIWTAIPGGEAFPAHFCGIRRDLMGYVPPSENAQIDPTIYVYCAFIAPGGM